MLSGAVSKISSMETIASKPLVIYKSTSWQFEIYVELIMVWLNNLTFSSNASLSNVSGFNKFSSI